MVNKKKLLGVILLLTLSGLLSGILTGCGLKSENISDGEHHDNTDPNAPKVIESEDITEFDCEYHERGAAESEKSKRYSYASFSMKKTEEGVECEYRAHPYRGEDVDVSFEADFDALIEVQKIIAAADVASCNGIEVWTDGLPEELEGYILVKYASGERIYAYCNTSVPYPCEIVDPLGILFNDLAGGVENYTEEELAQYYPYYQDVLQRICKALADPDNMDDINKDVAWVTEPGEYPLDRLGYAMVDISGNGVPELLIGRLDTAYQEEDTEVSSSEITALYTLNPEDGSVELSTFWWLHYYLGDGRFFYSSDRLEEERCFAIVSTSREVQGFIPEDYYFSKIVDGEVCFFSNYGDHLSNDPDISQKLDISREEFDAIEDDILSQQEPVPMIPLSSYVADMDMNKKE